MQVEPSKKTTVVNLFAGPGAGKSTFCAGVFASLKWLGVNCEMALEYAKDMVWQQSFDVLNNQLDVFGKQQNRLFRLNGKVDVIITDAQLINSLIYDAQKREQTRAAFVEMVLAEHWSYDNLNFFIERRKRYNPIGRLQTKTEAEQLDARISKEYQNKLKQLSRRLSRIAPISTSINLTMSHLKNFIQRCWGRLWRRRPAPLTVDTREVARLNQLAEQV